MQIFYKCLFIIGLFSVATNAQNRLKDHNDIEWLAYNGTFKLNEKFSLHTEYQWRRTEGFKNWQQSLLRLGLNYQFNPKIQFRLGYAWAETFPYGEYTLNGVGKDFTEHRIYEMATISDKINVLELSHRFMLEQRWIGVYKNAEQNKEDHYNFLNRMRYMLRLQLPLNHKDMSNKTIYAVAYDEIFIGFGKNVGENIFDQNRLGLLIGYKFSKNVKIEAGYLNQIVQLGREIDQKNVFQYNNGIIVNTVLNFDLTKS